MVRTRFAPSPTGALHVGSVRTALFAYLYAKRQGGQYILRIEDTDQARSSKASLDSILGGFAWLGLKEDEGPIHQMDRLDRYQSVVSDFLAAGQAYRCDCTSERLDTLRAAQQAAGEKPRYDGHCRDQNKPAGDCPFVVRLKTPKIGQVTFKDLIRGEITVENEELDDLVLLRSDGIPTYHLSVVVDDHDMRITHVIRGDDHINNTPRQIHIVQALGGTAPAYAHLPMILGGDGKRLSKRHGAVSVLAFREQGYLPEALLNYLVRLGWSHGDQEIFSFKEMIETFDLAHVSHSPAIFNVDKLNWINEHYLKNAPIETILPELKWHMDAEQIPYVESGPDLADVLVAQRGRCTTLRDMAQQSRYFYCDLSGYEDIAAATHLTQTVAEPFKALITALSKFEPEQWSPSELKACIKTTAKEAGLKMGQLGMPVRVAVTGGTQSPSLDVMLGLLGKETVIVRLEAALQYINTQDK